MIKQTALPQNVYELIENDNNEIMLLLYAGKSAPSKTSFQINETGKYLELHRNANDIVIIEGLLPESINKLKQIDTLYVCEMKYNEAPDSENEIIYAYAAQPKKQTTPTNKKQTSSSLAEKAQKAREKALKKEG